MQDQAIAIWTRRSVLAAAGLGAFATAAYALKPLAFEEPAPELHEAVRSLIGSRPLAARDIRIDVPAATGNGRSVPIGVLVESEMSETDRVEALHVLIMGNPRPRAASYRFGPDCGRARVAFRGRMEGSTSVVAVALFANGTACLAEQPVRIGRDGEA